MLTDKDLEELRQERHDDYVAEARRELEAAWDGEPRLKAWVDLGLGCAQALFPWDSRMAKDCDVGIRNLSHFGSPANMRSRGWPLLCGASLAPVSLEAA